MLLHLSMARHLFRKIVPSEQTMHSHRLLRIFGKTLLNRRLWHLNRHSTAWGVGAGLFWAWIGLPIQTIGAAAMAIAGRGNLALAVAFTWVSNPFTWIPCFLLSYYVGLFLTGAEPIHDLRAQIQQAVDAGPIEGIVLSARMLWADLPQLYPLLVGGFAIGTVSGIVGFVVVKLVWRWNIVRRWHSRHQVRTRLNPAQRLTSGFAHLARTRRRAAGHA